MLETVWENVFISAVIQDRREFFVKIPCFNEQLVDK